MRPPPSDFHPSLWIFIHHFSSIHQNCITLVPADVRQKIRLESRGPCAQELAASGLLVRAPKFSKFLHAAALTHPALLANTPHWFVPHAATAPGEAAAPHSPDNLPPAPARPSLLARLLPGNRGGQGGGGAGGAGAVEVWRPATFEELVAADQEEDRVGASGLHPSP
jgi:hypothetical protein